MTAIIVGSLYTVAVLAIGFAVGYLLSQQQVQLLSARLARQKDVEKQLNTKIHTCRRAGDEVVTRSEQLQTALANSTDAISAPLHEAVERLTEATRVLSRRLTALECGEQEPAEGIDRSPGKCAHRSASVRGASSPPRDRAKSHPAKAPPSPAAVAPQRRFELRSPGPAKEEQQGLHPDEVTEFTCEIPQHDADDRAPAPRYRYQCQQFLAPWLEAGPIPPSDAFRPVQCQDISSTGISFFTPKEPESATLAITVGAPTSAVLMGIQVMHSRTAYRHGQLGFLVGCRFIQRIGELSSIECEEANAVGA